MKLDQRTEDVMHSAIKDYKLSESGFIAESHFDIKITEGESIRILYDEETGERYEFRYWKDDNMLIFHKNIKGNWTKRYLGTLNDDIKLSAEAKNLLKKLLAPEAIE